MENFIVSARKYRPSTFQSVVGQQSLVATLQNAIKNNHIAHAYLFCGPRGVGKTTCARIFAKTINCQQLLPTGDACNECESCVSYNDHRSFNIHELDAASNNGVDEIKHLIEQVRIPPQIGKYSVYIIDEVHMLSASAFNAFLKTLEEPPAHAIFILATTEKHKIIPTILSRCQIYDFNRITVADTVGHLQFVASEENVTVEPEALNVIAQKSDGGMRDALSIFDQVVSFCGNNITYKNVIENLNVLDYDFYFQLVNAFLESNVPQSMMIFNEILNKGFDAHHFVGGLSGHLRDVMVCKDAQTVSLLEVGSAIGDSYKNQAELCDVNFLYSAMKIANDCDLDYRLSKNKRLLVEIMLIRLCQLSDQKKNKLIDNDNTVVLGKIFSNVKKPEPQPTKVEALVQKPVDTSFPAVVVSKPKPQSPPLNIAISSISINGSNADEINAVVERSQNRDEVFTEAELQSAWQSFVVTIPDQVHLCSTIKSTNPKLKENAVFEVELENSFQEKEIGEIKSKLLSFLSDKLENDKLEIETVINQTKEVKSVMLTKDKLEFLIEKNEHLKKLATGLGLEIM